MVHAAMSKHHDELKVFCDGGSRGNPGPSAAGVVITTTDGKVLGEYHKFLGIQTNNFAEYTAVVLALDELKGFDADKISFYLDSELVTKQLNGQYKVKHPDMKALFRQVQDRVGGLNISFTHVLRANNKLADEQVNICLDAQ